MEQIDMIISAKASSMLNENVKREKDEYKMAAKVEKIQVFKIISPGGGSESNVNSGNNNGK